MLVKVIDTHEEELKQKLEQQQVREYEEYQYQLMEAKKEILSGILELGNKSRVNSILSFEGQTDYLNDKHFLIENDEVSILEKSYKKLIEFKNKFSRDWIRIKGDS